MVMFRPSTWPRSRSPCLNASASGASFTGVDPPRKPMRQTLPASCASRASGVVRRPRASPTRAKADRMTSMPDDGARLPPAEARPHVRIHQHLGPLAAQDAQHLARDLHRRLAGRLPRDARHVRGAHDVLEVEDRIVPGRGLVLPDVEAGGGELATGQRLEERPLVLHRAARGVNEDGARLHEPDGFFVDHVLRLGREGRVTGEHVYLGQERLEALDRLRAAPSHLVVRHVFVVAEHAHPDRAGELRDAPAHVADADDAKRLAGELRVSGAARAPAVAPHRLVDREGALHGDEHQHQRMLGDSLGVGAGSVNDRDAEPGRGWDIHGVESDSMPSDDLELLTGPHQTFRASRPYPEQDPVRLRGRLDQTGLGLVLADDDPRLSLEEGFAVGVDGAASTISGRGSVAIDAGLLWRAAGHGFYYFQATRTRRGASSENGVPSSPP